MGHEIKKIYSAVDQAKVCDLGWFADTLRGLRRAVEENEPSEIKGIHNETMSYRFMSEKDNYILLYPAYYSFLQTKWVKENDLKVGDRVRLIRDWLNGENGYPFVKLSHMSVGDIFTVREIKSYTILVVEDDCAFLPYFAIEKVEGEYRPFANAEEFAPHRDKWWRRKSGKRIFKLQDYNDHGVSNTYYDEWSYEMFYRDIVNADTGEPAGVKL